MLSIYKASAGSGKTHTLTGEYLRMLFRDFQAHREQMMPHSHILAVTFTKKATAEMKERILKALFILSQTPEQSPYYDLLIKEFKIDTPTMQQ
jgi:ATP-dependent exoDNAse (exonuclease V) beta subunit